MFGLRSRGRGKDLRMKGKIWGFQPLIVVECLRTFYSPFMEDSFVGFSGLFRTIPLVAGEKDNGRRNSLVDVKLPLTSLPSAWRSSGETASALGKHYEQPL